MNVYGKTFFCQAACLFAVAGFAVAGSGYREDASECAFVVKKISQQLKKGEVDETDKQDIESIMLFLPLEVKWKAARINNTRPYVTAGFQYTLDMANRKRSEQGNAMSDEYKMKLDPHDFGVTVGLGWDFFLPYNNKIALEVKAYFGFRDVLFRENNIYTDRITRLNSRMIQVGVTFE